MEYCTRKETRCQEEKLFVLVLVFDLIAFPENVVLLGIRLEALEHELPLASREVAVEMLELVFHGQSPCKDLFPENRKPVCPVGFSPLQDYVAVFMEEYRKKDVVARVFLSEVDFVPPEGGPVVLGNVWIV